VIDPILKIQRAMDVPFGGGVSSGAAFDTPSNFNMFREL
jgi:hypothetical protein